MKAIVVLEHPSGYRPRIDLFQLTPRALSLLSRVEPRIANDPQFYAAAEQDRKVFVLPRTLLEKSGNVHRPEPVGGVLMTPAIVATDKVFDVGSYGSPRHPETFMRWLDGSAEAINKARIARDATRTRLLADVDARIDDWLKRVAWKGKRDLESVVRFDGADGWDLRWNSVPMAYRSPEQVGLQQRLAERIAESGLSKQAWLESHPATEELARAAVEHLAVLESNEAMSARA